MPYEQDIDKEILKAFAQKLFDYEIPLLESPEGIIIASEIQEKIWAIAHELHNRAIEL